MSEPLPITPAASSSTRWARWLALGALVVAVVAVLYVVTSGGSTQYTLLFRNAGQLVVGNQVQIGGVPHGTIDSISLTSNNQAKIVINVDEPFAPLHRGTTAEIRGQSLSGVANRFIALHPGPNSAPQLDDGAVLGKLVEDRPAFQQFLKATAATMSTLAKTSPQIDSLVANGASTFSATASQQQALRSSIEQAPSTLAAGNEAMTALGETLPDLNKLVDATKPAAPGLQPFFLDVQRFLETTKTPLGDLAAALDPSKPGLVSATNRLPALQRIMGPAAKHSGQALKRLDPMLAFARPYGPDLTAALTNFGQAAGAYDANGHYVRGTATFNAYKFDGSDPGTLTPNPPTDPLAGVQTGKTKRCPGGATQATADGSAPYVPVPGSCDPGQVPPK